MIHGKKTIVRAMNERRTIPNWLTHPAAWSIAFSTATLIVNVLQGNMPLVWAVIAILAGLAAVAMIVGLARASGGRLKWIDWAAVAGVFLGLWLGDDILGIRGQPIPSDMRRLIGPAIGAVAGALIGAAASRVSASRTAAER